VDYPYNLVKTALQAAPAYEGLVFGSFTPAVEGRTGEAAGQLVVTFNGQATGRPEPGGWEAGAALAKVAWWRGCVVAGVTLRRLLDKPFI